MSEGEGRVGQSEPVAALPAAPLAGAYWVEPGQLMVGPYPSAARESAARRTLGLLLNCGIRVFVNLMHEDARGLLAYEPILDRLAREREIRCDRVRFEIEDCSVPEREQMGRILECIAAARERAQPTYVHCWGGRGRAGIVAGVCLIRAGRATPQNVREVIGRLRGRDPLTYPSPETREQLNFVTQYCAPRAG